jgi:hypothetical protein
MQRADRSARRRDLEGAVEVIERPTEVAIDRSQGYADFLRDFGMAKAPVSGS